MEDSAFGKSINDLNRASSWIGGVCNGLKYLHERKLCHLDIKISNVLITDTDAAVICDFGSLTPTEAAANKLVTFSICQLVLSERYFFFKLLLFGMFDCH